MWAEYADPDGGGAQCLVTNQLEMVAHVREILEKWCHVYNMNVNTVV